MIQKYSVAMHNCKRPSIKFSVLLVLLYKSCILWCDCEELSIKVEFVKEWDVKSPKILFTFADIPHRPWCQSVKSLKVLTWLRKAMINGGKNGYLGFFLFHFWSVSLNDHDCTKNHFLHWKCGINIRFTFNYLGSFLHCSSKWFSLILIFKSFVKSSQFIFSLILDKSHVSSEEL